jgi:hypothetical protein
MVLFAAHSALAIDSAGSSGIWISPEELQLVEPRGCSWEVLLQAAQEADPLQANVSDGNSDNNVQILAAGIVFARLGDDSYRDKVIGAIQRLVAAGKPAGSTLRWGREVGAYVVAADLVGYRTAAFESWLRNIAEGWQADDGRTLLAMLHERPNNWGTMAFGTLAAIYAYLDDQQRLDELGSWWQSSVEGPSPGEAVYGNDLSWHLDPTQPLMINPMGAQKSGLMIDGIVPDDMRRNGRFSNPPPRARTSYHWETLQGMVMAARIFERLGRPIWQTGDRALYRAFHVLQDTWEQAFGDYRAEGDDVWMLPFLDAAYGTSWSAAYDPCNSRIAEHGKNIGWPWILGGSNVVIRDGAERSRRQR